MNKEYSRSNLFRFVYTTQTWKLYRIFNTCVLVIVKRPKKDACRAGQGICGIEFSPVVLELFW